MGVIIGGCLGHALCTGLAVMGGRFIAQKISVRTGESLYVICDVKVNNSKCQINLLCLLIIGTTTFITSKKTGTNKQ